MIKNSITIINKLGLHARAAAKLATEAGRFSSDISICSNGKTVNGKSVMSLMLLAASKGTVIDISIEGTDAHYAMQAITALINNRFEESE